MAKTREIKRRIKAVASIKRITKTMQMIATSRFQAAQKRATAAKPYAQKITELVGELSGGDNADPLLTAPTPKTGKVLLLVITSNRGLCGGYNGNILRAATHFFRDNPNVQVELEVVGKKGVNFFKFSNRAVSKIHSQFDDKPKFEQVDQVAEEYIKAFRAGKYDAVHVCYMSMISMSKQVGKVIQILPMAPPAEKTKAAKPTKTAVYDYTPDAASLLSVLLPAAVKTQLFQCFVEAVVGEQIARMVAMKSATDAAGKMGKELGRRYNRARQAAITTELTEIIAGAASLK